MKHITQVHGKVIRLVEVHDYEEYTIGELSYFIFRSSPRNWVAHAELSGLLIFPIRKSKTSLLKDLDSRLKEVGDKGVAKNAILDKKKAEELLKKGITTLQYKQYMGLPIRQRNNRKSK